MYKTGKLRMKGAHDLHAQSQPSTLQCLEVLLCDMHDNDDAADDEI
jgi:hypothetical protein